MYRETTIQKPNGNCKTKIYDIFTHKKGIKTQHQRQSSNHRREQKKKGKKGPKKTNPKNNEENGNVSIYTDNYLKCK